MSDAIVVERVLPVLALIRFINFSKQMSRKGWSSVGHSNMEIICGVHSISHPVHVSIYIHCLSKVARH